MPASVGPPEIKSSTGPAPRVSTYSVAPGTFTVEVSTCVPIVPITVLLRA